MTKSHFYDYIMLSKTLSYIRLEEETHCWFHNVSSYVGETHGKQELWHHLGPEGSLLLAGSKMSENLVI